MVCSSSEVHQCVQLQSHAASMEGQLAVWVQELAGPVCTIAFTQNSSSMLCELEPTSNNPSFVECLAALRHLHLCCDDSSAACTRLINDLQHRQDHGWL